jgi:hypothetical protein
VEWVGCWAEALAHCQVTLKHSVPSKWSDLPPQIVGALIALAAVIGIGVGVGVSLSNKNRTSTTNGNNSNGNSNSNSSNPVTQSDPNDPSTFQKDPRLIQSFYGIAYEPNGVIPPACGAKLSDVITDIQLMSQLTKVRVRSFSILGSLLDISGGYFWIFRLDLDVPPYTYIIYMPANPVIAAHTHLRCRL